MKCFQHALLTWAVGPGGPGCLPVDLAVEAVAPEHAVVGHVDVQGHHVLLGGHHLGVVPLYKVHTADLVTVSEEQVGALPWGRGEEEERRGERRREGRRGERRKGGEERREEERGVEEERRHTTLRLEEITASGMTCV